MGSLRRFIAGGAVFAWPLDGRPLQESRERHTVTGNPTEVDSPFGKAMRFDGAADYVTLGATWEDQLRFDPGTQDFSIAIWLRRSATGLEAIFEKRDSVNDGWTLYFDSDSVFHGKINATVVHGATPVADNLWHCAICVINRSGNGQLYFDGQPDGAPVAIGGAAMATTTIPRIGAVGYDGTLKFNGDIAKILVFDRVLTAQEAVDISSGHTFEYMNGLVSRWDMSDINPPDLGWRGYGNDGTGVNLVTATDIVEGIPGGKATEYAINECTRMAITAGCGLDFTGAFSYFCWLKMNSLALSQSIIGKATGATAGDNAARLHIVTNGKFQIYLYDGVTHNALNSNTAVLVGEWNLVGGSWDGLQNGDSVKTYLNGRVDSVGTGLVTSIRDCIGYDFEIGVWPNGAANYLNGIIDEAMVFDRALTELQARDLYELQKKGVL